MKSFLIRLLIIFGLLLPLAAPAYSAPLAPDSGTTERASLASDGTQGDDSSYSPSISADGRFVAFASVTTNLVPGDTNGFEDIFVRDRLNGITELVSLASDETQADGDSYSPSISADGRFVAFQSGGTNLVPGDTNGVEDIFVRDRLNGVTERVSLASDETQADGGSAFPSISADGRFVAFQSGGSNLAPGDTNDVQDVFVRDRLSGTTERISLASDETQGDGDSALPSISADGRFVAFNSPATNLVPGDTNGMWDVFVRDRLDTTTERISVASDETQGDDGAGNPSISDDGRFVAFVSFSTNLVPGDTNDARDVFVRDRLAGTTERISLASDGTQEDDSSNNPSISSDGRFVAFNSSATNLVPGDTNGMRDVFVRDRLAGTTERISLASDETQANNETVNPAISASGRFVAFESQATNLVPGDTNGMWDVFVRDRLSSGFMLYLPLASSR